MTADAMPGDRDRCLGLGMQGYVTKPVRLEQLRAEMLAALPADTTAAAV